ncbi:MAG: hypothetical protein AAGC88_13340 [Bacteroidota bacterium]
MRIRPGDMEGDGSKNWDTMDGITIMNPDLDSSVNHILIDHCSISWGVDENIGIWHDAHNITIQNSIIAEALNSPKHPKGPNHSMGVLIGHTANNISLYNNLFSSNNDRNPLIISRYIEADINDNIIYNPGSTAMSVITDKAIKQVISFTNNWIIHGPNTSAQHELVVKGNSEGLQLTLDNNTYSPRNSTVVYSARTNTAVDNINYSLQALRQPQKSIQPNDFVENKLMRRLKLIGAHVPQMDEIDSRLIREVVEKKGRIPQRRSSEFNWPRYHISAENAIEEDLDHDGMFDAWETSHGLNTLVQDHWEDSDEDGYTNIEEFLNGTNPNGTNTTVEQGYLMNAYSIDPGDFNLALYPNPVSYNSNINMEIPFEGHINIDVYDMHSNLINSIDEYVYPGQYVMSTDWSDTNTPFVICCLRQGQLRTCQKVLINH